MACVCVAISFQLKYFVGPKNHKTQEANQIYKAQKALKTFKTHRAIP